MARHCSGIPRGVGGGSKAGDLAEEDPKVVPLPKRMDDLDPAAKEMLSDFARWRSHFFKRFTPAFQIEMCTAIQEGGDQLYLVPPGHGKTTLLTHDFVIFDMLNHRVRGQFYACLLVSQTQDMASAFLRRIRQTLERNAALIEAYGSFRPDEDQTWKESALIVDGFTGDDDGRAEEKEPTFIAAGRGTQIYGWRVRRIIGDDLIGKKESFDPDQTEKIAEWVHEELESRLETGDTDNIVFAGTRFSPHELYAKLIEARDEDGEPLYRVVTYKAHDESMCSGAHCGCKGACSHHPAYPQGCTLWPQRLNWTQLRRVRARLNQTRKGRFEFVYNQEETATGDSLCEKAWVEACKDPKRELWNFPKGVSVICTLDPAAENWTVAQCWGYARSHEALVDLPSHYLINQHRARMTGPQIVGLMRSWTLKLRELGAEPTWIVETNAFQKWLIQFNDFRQMRYDLGGLKVIPHATGQNKLDADMGVYSLGPPFEFGKVSLPWHGYPEREAVAPLAKELVTYPGCETTDCVMAAWFYIHHVKRMARTNDVEGFLDMPIPPYLLARRKQVPMYN